VNAAPLVVGFLALLGLSAMLVVEQPSPGRLTRAHADLEGGHATCATCHAPEGLDAGCLGCHHEIGRQVESGRGFHADRGTGCAGCHPDHHGEEFDALEAVAWRPEGREAFRHAHVEFRLAGRHEGLACEACHRESGTYLGLDQDCASCHEDVHRGRLFSDCASCHTQERFKPAGNFDHDRVFPLLGRHAEAACGRCHDGLDFKDVKGRTCEACHESPHRFPAPKGCEECHAGSDDAWGGARESFDAARHAAAGFRLVAAHAALECAKCHVPGSPYPERFREPPRVSSDCRACHEDVHRGQFPGACTECHGQDRFVPARYGRGKHVSFALKGAHERTACDACHTVVDGARRFVGTPRDCASCHEDPHRGQFEEGCASCHDERSFRPARYPIDRHTRFALDGAHGAVACNSCHTEVAGVRRFAGTPKDCASCHDDPHGGQFAREMKKNGCATCHGVASFQIRPFDHARRASYRLEGAHAKATCARCHRPVGKPPVRRYRETARDCASCHRDEHRGQFAGRACTACHEGYERWTLASFDHTGTRFPLDGRHRRVACADCHPGVRQADGVVVTQYRPLGRQCKDCHEVERR
jgi:hypothetical protein